MVFPELEELTGVPGLMAGSVEQHAAFHGGLEAFIAYLDTVKSGEAAYSGTRLRDIIDSFAPVLTQHLHDEIKSLLRLDEHGDKRDWPAFMKAMADKIGAKIMADPESKASSLTISRRSGPSRSARDYR